MIDKRMMYAYGQLVKNRPDGKRPGYRGSDYASVADSQGKSNTSQKDTSGADYGGGNQGRDAANSSGADDRSSDTQKYNHYEAISKNTGIDNNPLRPEGVDPGFIKPGDIDNLALSPYEQRRVDFLNTPYEPMNIPPFIPGGMILNTVGNFIGNIGNTKNKEFFANNVAGKYGYDYDPTQTGSYEKAYERYMKERMAGEVGAYGNEEQGQNALSSNQGGGGIMDVYTDSTTDDTEDTTDDTEETIEDIVLRFQGKDRTLNPAAAGVANTDALRAMIQERLKKLYT